jgi:phenylalanyl-tRNA synthetase beta chain
MKFTLSWLRDYLDTDEPLDALANKLSLIGLEVEGIENPAEKLGAFTTAKVLEAVQHPNADRLRVCRVETKDGEFQVVCGAPNARTGMVGVFAPPGTHIPGTGMDLKPGIIRGVESNGMLVSEREMGLSDEHDGIIELPEDTDIGTPLAEILGLDDPVIDIAITPNRGDALGVYGVARDLSAAGMGKFKDAKPEVVQGAGACPVAVRLDLDADTRANCPAFGLRLVRGVKNGPSPDWLQQRLKSIGLRPINRLVDITNYITYDRGRPLHVFDAAKVKGDLVVRMAQDGEEVLALDGKTYVLDPSMTVIADDTGVESIAGIMGGEVSGCDETTTDVLIESALWDPINIAATGRKLGIHSDARYRFERHVDPAFMVPGLEQATRMVLDLCGGEATQMTIAGAVPDDDRIIDFNPAQVQRLTGLHLHIVEIKAILRSLGFWMSGPDDAMKVAIPSYRPDVHEAADLVEEITRIVGVDRVHSAPLDKPAGVPKKTLTLRQSRARNTRRTLAARGLVEAVTWSFIDNAAARLFGGGEGSVILSNPISADMSDMRPSLLPGLIAVARGNADRGLGDSAVFEVGATYHGDRPEDQLEIATGLRVGIARHDGGGRHWRSAGQSVDAFDAKADALAVLDALGAPLDKLQTTRTAPGWYHPGRSGTLQLGPKMVLAHFGELHPAILDALDIKGPAVAFELDLDALPAPKSKATRAKPALEMPDLMPVRRDFAFIVGKDAAADALVRAARGAEKALISDVTVFDIFEGDSIGADKVSVAIEVTLQPRDKTLTDADIEAVAEKVVAQVKKATGGTLRG